MILTDITQPIAIILIGLPGSGKSTWIKNNIDINNYAIISSDDILEKIAKEKNLTYDAVWKDYIGAATGKMKTQFNDSIAAKVNIVVDQTNLSKKKRKGILQKLPSDYYKIAVVFDVLDNELYRRLDDRAKTTGKTISKNVIMDMGKRYESPSLDEGFNKIIRVNTNGTHK